MHLVARQTRGGWARCYDAVMSVEYFEERRDMVAAIRVIAQHLAAEVGKATLDDRVLRAMAKVPGRSQTVCLPKQAAADRFR